MEPGRAPVWKEGGEGPGRVWGHQQLASGGPQGPSVLTAFLRGPTGEWGGSWATGPLLTLWSPTCPLCDLGQVPTCLALLCHVCNRDGAAVTYMSWLHCPPFLFNPVRLGKLSSHRCGSGEVLSLRVLCFPQRFPPRGSSLRVSFIFL